MAWQELWSISSGKRDCTLVHARRVVGRFAEHVNKNPAQLRARQPAMNSSARPLRLEPSTRASAAARAARLSKEARELRADFEWTVRGSSRPEMLDGEHVLLINDTVNKRGCESNSALSRGEIATHPIASGWPWNLWRLILSTGTRARTSLTMPIRGVKLVHTIP